MPVASFLKKFGDEFEHFVRTAARCTTGGSRREHAHVKLTIDQREIEAREGETVLQAARATASTSRTSAITTSCRSPAAAASASSRSTTCPSCSRPATSAVAPKMIVETERRGGAAGARRTCCSSSCCNHPVDCGICDKAGECRLQDYQHRYGPAQTLSREPKQHKRKLHDLGPRITLDNERCILCSRCVRFTREISRQQRARHRRARQPFVRRGADGRPLRRPVLGQRDRPVPDGRAAVDATSCTSAASGSCEPVRSVCTGCARGCSIKVWRRMQVRQPQHAGHGPGQRRLPHDGVREPGHQRSVALQQGLRPAQVDGTRAPAAAAHRRPGRRRSTRPSPGPGSCWRRPRTRPCWYRPMRRTRNWTCCSRCSAASLPTCTPTTCRRTAR